MTDLLRRQPVDRLGLREIIAYVLMLDVLREGIISQAISLRHGTERGERCAELTLRMGSMRASGTVIASKELQASASERERSTLNYSGGGVSTARPLREKGQLPLCL